MGCATDELLAAWAAGQVGGAERDSLDTHAAGCSLCRGVMMALAGVTRTAQAVEGIEGDAVGGFHVIRRGTTTILARDPTTEKEVAVRVLPATTEVVREAQALLRFQHAALVRVLTVDVVGDELIVATEIVDGTPFAEWLTRSRSPSARAKVLASVGRGLNVLHAHRITHGAVTRDSILVRRDGTGVLVGPAFGSTAKDDQAAWWRVVAETLGRPRALRPALAKGLAEDPNKRYPSMDAAVMALRNRAGDRSYVRWVALVVVALFVVGLVTGLTAKSNRLSNLAKTSKCPNTATLEWRAMRIPVIAKLGAAGADITRVIRHLDDRTLRTATLQRETCSNASEQRCVDAVWHAHAALFPELIDPDPEVTRAAVDELVRLPAPDRCLHGMTGTRYASVRAKILHVELANLPASDRVQRLVQLKDEVVALKDDGVSARWHLAIGVASIEADDRATAQSELESAANVGKLSGDVDTFVRALTYQVQISDHVDATLEHRAEAAASTIDNPALSAEVAHAEAIVRTDDDEGSVAKARDAKRQWDAIAIDAHANLVETDWLLAYELRATGAIDDAATVYDQALLLSRKRWGDQARRTLDIRTARALTEVARGHYDTARAQLVMAAEGFERLYGVNDDVAQTRDEVCACDLAAKTPSASCDVALTAAVEAYGDHDPRLMLSLDLVAQEALLTHHDDAAIAACERALELGPDPAVQAHLAIALHRSHGSAMRVKKLATAARKGLPDESSALAELDAELK